MVWPGAARSQGVAFEAARLIDDPDWSSYRIVFSGQLSGVLGYGLLGSLFRDRGRLDERLWGLGGDLMLFRGGQAGPYAVAGLTGGIGTGEADDFWGSWSAGLGYELYPLHFLTAALEGRWRDLSPGSRSGIELGLSLGINWGGGRAGSGDQPPAVPESPLPESPLPSRENPVTVPQDPQPEVEPGAFSPPDETTRVLEAVVQTATRAMGTPYKWGGRGEGGFDCSGLIQHAYGEHGIPLPRRSVDQAKSGQPVERVVGALRPGDILTFSTREGPVTHVGLYVGGDQFIHSASNGVQLSRFSNDDPYGRWWWERWVGARRVLN
jgi:cell wall-associated NlpC family hydrolase